MNFLGENLSNIVIFCMSVKIVLKESYGHVIEQYCKRKII
jgi:hypothetical protein